MCAECKSRKLYAVNLMVCEIIVVGPIFSCETRVLKRIFNADKLEDNLSRRIFITQDD